MSYLIAVLLVCLLAADLAEARGGRSSGGQGGIGYIRPSISRNGTYRSGYYHTNPDSSKLNNWSTRGNVNPYTGKKGYRDPLQR